VHAAVTLLASVESDWLSRPEAGRGNHALVDEGLLKDSRWSLSLAGLPDAML
jgi:hypothetical protein